MHFDINLVLILDFCTSLDQSSCNIYCFILGARCSWRQCRRLLSPKHLDCLLLDLPNTAGTAHEISRIDHWISRNSLEIHQDFSTFLEDLEKSYGEILLKFCFILFLCEALVFPVSCIFSAANWNNWKIPNPLPTLCILYPSLCAEISADIHRASDLLRSRHPSLVAQGRPQPSNVDSTRFSTCFITYHHLCQVDSPTKEWLKSVDFAGWISVEWSFNVFSMSFRSTMSYCASRGFPRIRLKRFAINSQQLAGHLLTRCSASINIGNWGFESLKYWHLKYIHTVHTILNVWNLYMCMHALPTWS